MSRANGFIAIPSTANTTSVTGGAIDTNQVINATFQTIMGDSTAAGTVKVQGSNDTPPAGYIANGFVPTNWSDIPNATATVVAGVAPLIVTANVACQYMRAVYTRTSGGSTTIIVKMFVQGV